MFRRAGINISRSSIRGVASSVKYGAAEGQFGVRATRKGGTWVPLGIFGASFALGWYFTRHMTFTDLMAYWRYDRLPQDAPEVARYQNQLYQKLDRLNVVKQLEQNGYIQVLNEGGAQKGNELIDTSLQTPGGIAIPPRFYFNPITRESVGIYHLGMKLTGYPFIVHGGILATVIEDLMRRGVKMAKGKDYERTQDIEVSYRKPTLANQFVVVRTTKIEGSGNDVKLNVDVMDQDGNRILVRGKGSFSV